MEQTEKTYLDVVKAHILELLNSEQVILDQLDKEFKDFGKELTEKEIPMSTCAIRISDMLFLVIARDGELPKECYKLYVLSNDPKFWDDLEKDENDKISSYIVSSIYKEVNIDFTLTYNRETKTLSEVEFMLYKDTERLEQLKELNREDVMLPLKDNLEIIKNKVIGEKTALIIPLKVVEDFAIFVRFSHCEKEGAVIAHTLATELDREFKEKGIDAIIEKRFDDAIKNQSYSYQALIDLETQSILTEEHLMLDKTLTEVKKVMN